MKAFASNPAFRLAIVAWLMATDLRADSLDAWSLVHSDANSTLACVTYGPAGFVAGGADATGGLILRSEDGTQWSKTDAPASDPMWRSVVYAQGAYVVVGSQGTILRSTNGTKWTEVRHAGQDNLDTVAFGNGLFVAGGLATTSVGDQSLFLTSSDGIRWTRLLLGQAANYASVTTIGYAEEAFLAGLSDGSLWRSDDAINWTPTQLQPGASAPLAGIANGLGRAVIVGGRPAAMFSSSARVILTSIDGIHWQAKTDQDFAPLFAIAYGTGFFVAMGSDAIYSSEDGSCWSARPMPSSEGLKGVAFGNDTFVAVGNSGTILRSATVHSDAIRVKFPSCDVYVAREQDGQIQIPVVRVGTTESAINVRYTTADGTAVAGQDYESTEGMLTFASGETERTITLRILDDSLPEGTESFSVRLHDATGGAELGKPDSATIQILDNDSAHLDHWVQSVPQVQECCLSGVAYGNGAFVTVGFTLDPADQTGSSYRLAILRSTDGQEWQDVSPGTLGILRAVCWGTDRFVAGGRGQILSSQDGIAWTGSPMAGLGDLESICYGNGRFVAVGSGQVLTSVDGVNWAFAATSFDSGATMSVAYGNGVFVVLGGNFVGSTAAWTNFTVISNDGISWTAIANGFAHPFARIVFGNDRFVAVGTEMGNQNTEKTGIIATSADGRTWTQQLSAPGVWLDVAAHANGTFLVMGTDWSKELYTETLFTSSNGIAWRTNNKVPFGNPGSAAYGGGLYVVSGGGAWTSPDTVAWQERLPAKVDLIDITFGDGLFVAVGSTILTSPNGSQWTRRSGAPPSGLGGVAFGDGLFVAVSAEDGVAISRNGIEWSSRTLATNAHLSRIAYGNGRFLAIGGSLDIISGDWTNRVFVSLDGLRWTETYSDSQNAQMWQDITFGKDQFVVVGWGLIATSLDGASWTMHEAGITDQLSAITYGNGMFVAVGGNASFAKYESASSVIITSPDGVTWTSRLNALGEGRPFISGWPLTGVVYGGSTFVAVGTGTENLYDLSHDVVVTSADGAFWTTRQASAASGLSRIATGNGLLAAVGRGGRILRPGVLLNITSAGLAANPGRTLTVSSEIGLRHEVQVSTNLVDWSALTSLTTTNFTSQVLDATAPVVTPRFYRTRELTD